MDLSDFLEQTSLIDCNGQVTHTLIRQLDGSIKINIRNGRTIHIDGVSFDVLTPGATVPEPVMAAARAFAR